MRWSNFVNTMMMNYDVHRSNVGVAYCNKSSDVIVHVIQCCSDERNVYNEIDEASYINTPRLVCSV